VGRQPLCCFLQQVQRLAEGEAHLVPAEGRPAVERRARHRRDADLAGEPEGEFVVGQVAQRGEVRQHVVGALGRRRAEAGRP
jgi:hypothetical protein